MSEAICKRMVEAMQERGINFLAIDFDMTLISEHTYGQWVGTVKDLAAKVRPVFKTLLPQVLATDVSVAIVTFSGQTQTISAVLQYVFPEIASRIVIRGEDRSWVATSSSRNGKQCHMASASEELMEKNDNVITTDTTLLIDDDANNIRFALQNQTRAILFDPDNIQKFIEGVLKLNEVT